MSAERSIRFLPQQEERVETGAVQFGDDWPGLFIRGDDCMVLRIALESVKRHVAAMPGHDQLAVLQGLWLLGVIETDVHGFTGMRREA
jgi:hypothetical protein